MDEPHNNDQSNDDPQDAQGPNEAPQEDLEEKKSEQADNPQGQDPEETPKPPKISWI